MKVSVADLFLIDSGPWQTFDRGWVAKVWIFDMANCYE